MGEKENIKEKVKIVKEAIKDFPLTDAEKLTALVITAMGGNPTRFLVDALSMHETERAERENPKMPIPMDYTEVERIIHEMLIENTGAHILDSGSIYGRHWEDNRKISDFRRLPSVNVTVWDDGMVNATINVFHHLTAFLERDELCEELERKFYEFAENQRGSWFALMKEFASEILEDEYGFKVVSVWNTYNHDNLLSQGLQGITFCIDEDYYYIILQIHNGCDIRGGYTKPRFFKLGDEEVLMSFEDAMCYLSASCECTRLSTNDCGHHWEMWDLTNDEMKEVNEFPEYWKPIPKHENPKAWELQVSM